MFPYFAFMLSSYNYGRAVANDTRIPGLSHLPGRLLCYRSILKILWTCLVSRVSGIIDVDDINTMDFTAPLYSTPQSIDSNPRYLWSDFGNQFIMSNYTRGTLKKLAVDVGAILVSKSWRIS